MSLYNMLFGINPQTDLLLAALGLRKNDVQRLRNVFLSDDGKTIEVYTRTGGGNRDDYPNLAMRKLPTWQGSVDDDYDSTYCTDKFVVPDEFVADVLALSDMIGNGIRREFGQHLARTLRREPTDDDKAQAAYEAESAALRATQHVMANGHTFVPYDDSAMRKALELAEANGGKLRSCWGVMPLTITVTRDTKPWPKALNERDRAYMERVKIGYEWKIDEPYWQHCQERWATEFPLTMANIAKGVETHREKRRA